MRKTLNTIAASLLFTSAALVFGLSQTPNGVSVSAQSVAPTITVAPTDEGSIGGVIIGGTLVPPATATAFALTGTARAGATGTASANATTAANTTPTAAANASATAAVVQTATESAHVIETAVAGATSTTVVRATGTASANQTATAAPGATSTSIARATGTAVAGATSTTIVRATGTASANQTATAAPGATATAGVRATGTAVAGATSTTIVRATGTASANQTATAAPGATATAGVRATGTAIAGATSTAVTRATGTAIAGATATAAPGATATAGVRATGTAIAGATSTTIVRATGTASANQTATAAPGATATAGVHATGTAIAGATSTSIVRATGTAIAGATATAAPGATATAGVHATGTAIAGATSTSIVRATGTASVYATSTAIAAKTATAAATSDVTLKPFEYTCQVANGTQTDGTTNQQCNEFFGQTLEFRAGTWWPVATYCMTNAQCKTNEGTTLGSYPELPCSFTVTPSGIQVDCSKSGEKSNGRLQTWNINAQTSTTCPINEVLRSPYPRTLVNVDTNFVLQPKEFNDENGFPSAPQTPANVNDFIDAFGNPTAEGYDIGVWKNLRLIMRSKRFTGGETWFGDEIPYPKWEFTDRAWNPGKFPKVQQGPAVGPRAKYLYETSSADLTTKLGREFDIVNKVPANLYDLPAYPVKLSTYCGHEWMVTVDLPTKNWNKTGACYGTILYPNGSTYEPPGTNHADCAPGQVAPGSWVYGWIGFQTGRPGSNGKWQWDGIDLKLTGAPVSYATRTMTKGGGIFKDRTSGVAKVYWDDPLGVWVPVVEVQSTIRDQCVYDGSCEPIGAEAGSLNKP